MMNGLQWEMNGCDDDLLFVSIFCMPIIISNALLMARLGPKKRFPKVKSNF